MSISGPRWSGDNEEIYETLPQWGTLNAEEDIQAKIELIRELIPADVCDVLDVGCGDGAITNVLAQSFDVVGVDRSAEALKFVTAPTVKTSADDLPFADGSFDLVLSSEMLEHLPEIVLAGASTEILRVAREWILIAVPNEEDLDASATRCPVCGTWFHVYNHLHSFDESSIEALFPGFEIAEVRRMGKPAARSIRALSRLASRYGRGAIWYKETRCPKCGNRDQMPVPGVLDRVAVGSLGVIERIGITKPYWLIVLLKRSLEL